MCRCVSAKKKYENLAQVDIPCIHGTRDQKKCTASRHFPTEMSQVSEINSSPVPFNQSRIGITLENGPRELGIMIVNAHNVGLSTKSNLIIFFTYRICFLKFSS